MLKVDKKILEAVCDSCGKDLKYIFPGREDHPSANYAEVIPSFGYGSQLDPIGGNVDPNYHLCEDCFSKAMHAIGLPVEDLDPVICPVCRKPRNGRDDHPECMRKWYPHPDSDPQRELREKMDAHEKSRKEALDAGSDEAQVKPKVITLCGSTRFTSEMLDEAWRLTKLGHIVIHWNILNGPEAFSHGAENEGEEIRRTIDELYLHKVAMADEVRAINVGGYIGNSTRNELRHAAKLGKPITWLEPDKADKEFVTA